MARSLEKMREMEESVKLIPILQVKFTDLLLNYAAIFSFFQSQVSVLKEEKRLILLQVKAGEAEKNKMVSQMKEDKLPKLMPVSLGDLTNGNAYVPSTAIFIPYSLTSEIKIFKLMPSKFEYIPLF
jgi:hypothetical protein